MSGRASAPRPSRRKGAFNPARRRASCPVLPSRSLSGPVRCPAPGASVTGDKTPKMVIRAGGRRDAGRPGSQPCRADRRAFLRSRMMEACLPGLHAGPEALVFVFLGSASILRHGRRGSRLRMIGWRACIADGVVVVAGASGLAVSWSARLGSGALLDGPCFRHPCPAPIVSHHRRRCSACPCRQGRRRLAGRQEVKTAGRTERGRAVENRDNGYKYMYGVSSSGLSPGRRFCRHVAGSSGIPSRLS